MSIDWPDVPAWMDGCPGCVEGLRHVRAGHELPAINETLNAPRSVYAERALSAHIAQHHPEQVPTEWHPDCWVCASHARFETKDEKSDPIGAAHRARSLFLPPDIARL